MKKIPAAEFRARCLALMEDVRSTKQPLLITKRGKAVAKLVPVDDATEDFIGRLKGVFRVVGDIESHIVPLEEWGVLAVILLHKSPLLRTGWRVAAIAVSAIYSRTGMYGV